MPKRRKARTRLRDPYYLYTAAVQSVEVDLSFFKRLYKKERGKSFRLLREDFCGTAVLARRWVRHNPENRAWGVDLDSATLEWGETHYGPAMGISHSRLELICSDVREVRRPRIDIVAALNFSYSVFKTRAELASYFRQVRRSLRPDGIFILDAWGGTEAMVEDEDRRRIDADKAFDGTRIPPFTYVWEQARFNPIDHHILCHIHFKLADGTRLRRAFTYDWRLWTLPELQELLREAGFRSTAVHAEGWDDKENEANGIFRRKTYFDNGGSWVTYVVGLA